MKNSITDNISLIEIKSPLMDLVTASKYREGTNVYSATTDLTGAVIQVNSYRDKILKQFYAIKCEEGRADLRAINPSCIVIAGNRERMNPDQLTSFELFRSSLSGVTLITFDELCDRIRLVIDLIVRSKDAEGTETVNTAEEAS